MGLISANLGICSINVGRNRLRAVFDQNSSAFALTAGFGRDDVLPESYRTNARYTSRKVTLGEPRELQNSSKVTEQLSERCRKVASGGKRRPRFGTHRPFWPHFGRTRPNLAKARPIWSFWANFGRRGQTRAEFGGPARLNFVELRPHFRRFGPHFRRFGQTLAICWCPKTTKPLVEFRPHLVVVGQYRDQFRSTLTELAKWPKFGRSLSMSTKMWRKSTKICRA